MLGLNLSLGLGMRTGGGPAGPTGVTLSGNEFDDDDTGEVATLFMVGGVEPYTSFTLLDGSDEAFSIATNKLSADGSQTAGETSIMVQVTDAIGQTFDAVLPITISEAAVENPVDPGDDPVIVPDPEDPEIDQGGFQGEVVEQDTSSGTKITGKNNGTAVWVKPLPDILLSAGSQVTFAYTADDSGMSKNGREAARGFVFKNGNPYHLSGVRGNGANPAVMLASRLHGDFRKANQFTITNDGSVTGITKDGPTYLRLIISGDGETYAISAGPNTGALSVIQTGRVPTPMAGVDDATEFGIGAYFSSADKGISSTTLTALSSLALNTVLPTITGTATVGETLTASTGTWDGGVSTISGYTYQWYADGVAISGATASTYELTEDELGAVITVAVVATTPEGESAAATSAGTDPVTELLLLDGLSPTAAWSFSRDLVSSFAGSPRYTDISTAITDWHDQTGNARDLTDLDTVAVRPTLSTAGPQSRACADLNSDGLHSSQAISDFITNSTGYVVVVGMLDAYTGGSVTLQDSPAFFMDSNKVMGIFARLSATAIGGMNHDGGFKTNPVSSAAGNTVVIMEWRHEGGSLHFRLTRGQTVGSWVSQTAGNTSNMTGTVRMGYGASANWLDGKLFEAMTFNTVPDDTTRNALIDDIIAWYC